MIKLEDKLYTSTEVADILGVSLRSVYRYIEEGKLNAEVKTATGRHRFTKQNIVDFLYPNDDENHETSSENVKMRDERPAKAPKEAKVPVEQKITEPAASKVETEIEENVEVKEEKEAEPIDWLAKFREAAKKFEEERSQAQKVQEETPEQEPVTTPAPQESEDFQGLAGIVEPEPADAAIETPSVQSFYYRSRLGGLKDIAQNIDKSSRNSNVDYAFTLNAGLSLFKPIKPFSVLHAYVRPKDREFFERVLMLVPSDETNAQLCLLTSEDNNIYDYKTEMHGLFVVSKQQLLDDVRQSDDSSLSAEAESVLR
jgi:excisionase family DNA binding protein